MSSAASGVMKKVPAAASTPAAAPSALAKSNAAVLKHTAEPTPVTITDNEVSFCLFLTQNTRKKVCVVCICLYADGAKALIQCKLFRDFVYY